MLKNREERFFGLYFFYPLNTLGVSAINRMHKFDVQVTVHSDKFL